MIAVARFRKTGSEKRDKQSKATSKMGVAFSFHTTALFKKSKKRYNNQMKTDYNKHKLNKVEYLLLAPPTVLLVFGVIAYTIVYLSSCEGLECIGLTLPLIIAKPAVIIGLILYIPYILYKIYLFGFDKDRKEKNMK